MNKLKPQRTKSFDHTIRGLLTKRRDIHHEAEQLQTKLAELRNDVLAIDRALYVLGYDKDTGLVMPRQVEGRIFARNELARMVVAIIREANGPLSSRAIAAQIVTERGEDADDRKHMNDMTTRVSRSLQGLHGQGRVKGTRVAHGHMAWERSSSTL